MIRHKCVVFSVKTLANIEMFSLPLRKRQPHCLRLENSTHYNLTDCIRLSMAGCAFGFRFGGQQITEEVGRSNPIYRSFLNKRNAALFCLLFPCYLFVLQESMCQVTAMPVSVRSRMSHTFPLENHTILHTSVSHKVETETTFTWMGNALCS